MLDIKVWKKCTKRNPNVVFDKFSYKLLKINKLIFKDNLPFKISTVPFTFDKITKGELNLASNLLHLIHQKMLLNWPHLNSAWKHQRFLIGYSSFNSLLQMEQVIYR